MSLYKNTFLPVALPVSLLAGLSIELILKPVLSSSGRAKSLGSHVALVAVYGSAAAYYTLCRSNSDDYWWERRMRASGEIVSSNAKTGATLVDGGERAEASSDKRAVFEALHLVRGALGWFGIVPSVSPSASKTTDLPTARNVYTAPLDLDTMHERRALFELVDLLVRLKALGAQGGGEGEGVVRRIEAEYGVRDAVAMLRDCELARSCQLAAERGGAGGAARELEGALLRLREQPLQSVFSTTTASRRRGLDLLSSNLPALETALEEQLRYRIPAYSAPLSDGKATLTERRGEGPRDTPGVGGAAVGVIAVGAAVGALAVLVLVYSKK